jgi:hypothetical protein
MGDDQRRTMYNGFDSVTHGHSDAWVRVAFAGDARFANCPCRECRNLIRLKKVEVSYHVSKHGFMPNYLVWREHGEVETTIESDGDQDVDRMEDMVDDIRNEYPKLQNNQALPEDVKEFYKLLEASEAKVHEGTDVTVLQAITRLMVMKSKHSFSNNYYNDIVKLIIDLIPSNHNMPKNLYHCKKIVAGLSMHYQKIDACEDNYMLFWNEHEKTTHCIHYGKSRYAMVLDEDGNEVTTNMPIKQLRYMPITPRLKRLFLNQETTKQMRWHEEGDCQDQDPDIMVHPSDGKAWQALVRFDLEFTRDLRGVCLGLSMDGFTPYTNNSTSYLCWPVFMMPYNLPPINA